MSYESLLTDTVTLKVASYTSTNGVNVMSYSAGTPIKVRLEPLSSSRHGSVMGKFPNATHMMYAEKSVTILQGDHIVDANSITYEVSGVMDYFGHHKEVALEQMR